MKVKKATIGATAAFSSTARKARPCPPPAPMKRVSQKTCGTKTEMNPATVKQKRISFQTIFHSMKKAWAIHRQPSRENNLSCPRQIGREACRERVCEYV